MWDIDYNQIVYRHGMLIFDGEPLEIYMAINEKGRLMTGLKCLQYFATYGAPYEDICLLYGIIRENASNELRRRLWGNIEEPMILVQDIMRDNQRADKKKRQ